MKLIMSPASPFARKPRIVLRETGQLDQTQEVLVHTTPFDTADEVAAANPLGKIPALVRNDGPTLYDSRVICRFLNDRAQASLYPATRIWEMLTLEATADGLMEAAVSMTYEARFKGTKGASGDWIDTQWAKIDRTLDTIESQWMSHLEGPLNIGQIGMASALAYVDFRHDSRKWRAQHPVLAAWEAEFAKRPAMVDTKPA
ncbi:glutathione S-transferase [Aestuariibius sp. HNIBRBA575]|uniref:glutathione S-transferase n=1 Tax=Aestuariibius sp. HNIBRBA575 TaxID=3233343 RepID=UPI0034A2A63C